MPLPAVSRERPKGVGAASLALAGIGPALGVASCCGLPVLLASAGIGTAWLAGIAMAAFPYREPLLVIAALCLLGGAALLLRQRAAVRTAPARQPGFGWSPWPDYWSAPHFSGWAIALSDIAPPQLRSAITCPACGTVKTETMPTNACQFFCSGCGTVLRPKPGDCCVFCSYGTVPCPPIQIDGKGVCCG